MRRGLAGLVVFLSVVALAVSWRVTGQEFAGKPRKVSKTEQEWAKVLTPAQFHVCREKGTEPAFSGRYVNTHASGRFVCVACGAELFSSKAKFDSGTGWPSFWEPIGPKQLDQAMDYKMVEPRVEVMCNDCGAHLGHVFDDGPPPTGLRYCINSVALKFVPGTSGKTTKTKAKPPAKATKKDAKSDEEPAQNEKASTSDSKENGKTSPSSKSPR